MSTCGSQLPGTPYALNKSYSGTTFFDAGEWGFGTQDWTGGVSEYVNRSTALHERLVEAHEQHAILRTGELGKPYRRKSVRLTTTRSWMYGLIALRFSHVPFGCGVWPAFWTNAASGHWPGGGEVDILELANYGPSKMSFHTGGRKRCVLEPGLVRDCLQRLPIGLERWLGFDCFTDYRKALMGCAPAMPAMSMTGPEWSASPGVLAAEWTARHVKIFYFPEAYGLPADLRDDRPTPDAWDSHLVAFFPFAASDELSPGSCPDAASLLEPQSIVLNIALCGNWASSTFRTEGPRGLLGLRGSCASTPGRGPDSLSKRTPNFTLDAARGADDKTCLVVEQGTSSPHYRKDCCVQHVTGTSWNGDDAFWNISWLKVYQQPGGGVEGERAGKRPTHEPPPPEPTIHTGLALKQLALIAAAAAAGVLLSRRGAAVRAATCAAKRAAEAEGASERYTPSTNYPSTVPWYPPPWYPPPHDPYQTDTS